MEYPDSSVFIPFILYYFCDAIFVMKKNITLLINKSEITAGTRGASLGPEAVMTAARKTSSLFFGSFDKEYIADANYLLDKKVKYPNAKRIEGLVQVFENVSSKIQEVMKADKFPLLLAGDHGSAGGTIAGVKAAHPNKRLGVVWIDAHGDLHTPYTTPSGNMHGMPLATALAEDNLGEKQNELAGDAPTRETPQWHTSSCQCAQRTAYIPRLYWSVFEPRKVTMNPSKSSVHEQ